MQARTYQKIRKPRYVATSKNKASLHWADQVWLELRLAGDGEKKATTVLFFPGTMASPWQYSLLLDEMQAAGFNVAAPHFPGHGHCRREPVPVFDKMLGLGIAAENWLQGHGLGPVVVAGHSQGAILALAHAGASQKVAGAFAVSAIFPQMPEAIGATRFASQAANRDKLLAFINAAALRLPFLPVPWFVYLQSDRIKKNAGKLVMPGQSMRSSYPLAFVASLFSAKIPEQANCPVWLITAKDDALFTQELAQKTFARIKASTKSLVWLENGGHLAALDRHGSRFVARMTAAACSSLGLPINLSKQGPANEL